MKVWFMADLHQEFAKLAWRPEVVPQHDVLVLAGDIHQPGARAVHIARELTDKPVVLVAGNHEAYGHEWFAMIAEAKAEAAKVGGVHYLENDAFEIGGVKFVGATLWTDFEYYPDRRVSYREATYRMNDFRLIRIKASGPTSDRFTNYIV